MILIEPNNPESHPTSFAKVPKPLLGNTVVSKSEVGLLTEGDSIQLSASESARLVVIGGKPHGEKNLSQRVIRSLSR